MRAARSLLVVIALAAAAGAHAADGWRTEIEGWHARETLTSGFSPWTDTGLAIEARTEAHGFLGARWRETERFDLRDSEAGLGARLPLPGGWGASADLTRSGTHRVLPRHSLLGQIDKQLGSGWGAQLGLKRSEFDSGRSDLRLLTLKRYFSAQRLAYTFYSGQPEGGGSAPSHRLQWSLFFGERNSLGISLAAGREVENVPPSALVSTDVRNVTLYGRYWFRPDWALSGEASWHEQGDLYRRHGIRLALRHRF